jgi:hypothetical protein
MHFEDLSPHRRQNHSGPPRLNVGWLDSQHDFPTGLSPVGLLERLRTLAPVRQTRGFHLCEFCQEATSSNEIDVFGDGVIYGAPMMILHYIDRHGYLPPEEFIDAAFETPAPAQAKT